MYPDSRPNDSGNAEIKIAANSMYWADNLSGDTYQVKLPTYFHTPALDGLLQCLACQPRPITVTRKVNDSLLGGGCAEDKQLGPSPK